VMVRRFWHPVTSTPRKRPELVAEGCNPVWPWDIAKLKGPVRGSYYYLYTVIDIYCATPSAELSPGPKTRSWASSSLLRNRLSSEIWGVEDALGQGIADGRHSGADLPARPTSVDCTAFAPRCRTAAGVGTRRCVRPSLRPGSSSRARVPPVTSTKARRFGRAAPPEVAPPSFCRRGRAGAGRHRAPALCARQVGPSLPSSPRQ
jgi:hypothetical protein